MQVLDKEELGVLKEILNQSILPFYKQQDEVFKKIFGIDNLESAIQLFRYLTKNPILDKINTPNWDLIDKIISCSHPEPLTRDEIMARIFLKEHQQLLTDFKAKVAAIKQYQKKGCPKQFYCKVMGGNESFCSNYFTCKKS